MRNLVEIKQRLTLMWIVWKINYYYINVTKNMTLAYYIQIIFYSTFESLRRQHLAPKIFQSTQYFDTPNIFQTKNTSNCYTIHVAPFFNFILCYSFYLFENIFMFFFFAKNYERFKLYGKDRWRSQSWLLENEPLIRDHSFITPVCRR